jgi:16S rRNA (cytosine1402-N4)-methyltransferase
MTKRFMRDMSQSDNLPRNLPIRDADLMQSRLRKIGRAVRASSQEVAANPRARSAVMRVAERTGEAGG